MNKIAYRDKLAGRIAVAIVRTLPAWDLLHTGDFSPEEDTQSQVIAERAYQIAD